MRRRTNSRTSRRYGLGRGGNSQRTDLPRRTPPALAPYPGRAPYLGVAEPPLVAL
jgi:hypothetical protein